MSDFVISVLPAAHGMFTVYMHVNGGSKNFEFCGSLPAVGDYIRMMTTHQISLDNK